MRIKFKAISMALKYKQNRTIVLSIPESEYQAFMEDPSTAHKQIALHYEAHPELFPKEIEGGYVLNGKTRLSKKLGIKMRKIKVGEISYRIRPSYVLPYLRAKAEEVSNALFLLRFGVPFWALACVFGRNAMWWYRLYVSLGRYSLVGTSIHQPSLLPDDLLADEHHTAIRGEKAYIATVVGSGCFLGMAACPKADEGFLEEGYGVFKQEALSVNPHYQPTSVNTDGWAATQKVWKNLFPTIQVIECFLHGFLKVRDRATKKLQAYFDTAADKIWEAYRAESKRSLAQQIRRLAEWAKTQIPDSPMKENILKLCKKKHKWMTHLDFPTAKRTSNMLDRLMRAMKRHAFNSQKFHGNISTTSMNFRAFALLYNFSPSSPSVWDSTKTLKSPAARLNGFVYHHHWLQNLLLAASCKDLCDHRNPL